MIIVIAVVVSAVLALLIFILLLYCCCTSQIAESKKKLEAELALEHTRHEELMKVIKDTVRKPRAPYSNPRHSIPGSALNQSVTTDRTRTPNTKTHNYTSVVQKKYEYQLAQNQHLQRQALKTILLSSDITDTELKNIMETHLVNQRRQLDTLMVS